MKVLVIGELCIDRFVYGVVKRISPEAPVPVLNLVEIIKNQGMAGNVVSNLKSLMDDVEVIHWHQTTNIEKIRFVEKKSNHMFIRVDEGGTEAAAASGVVGVAYAAAIPTQIFFVVDRPFLVFIIDQSNKLPLFAGRIVDPSGTFSLV